MFNEKIYKIDDTRWNLKITVLLKLIKIKVAVNDPAYNMRF